MTGRFFDRFGYRRSEMPDRAQVAGDMLGNAGYGGAGLSPRSDFFPAPSLESGADPARPRTGLGVDVTGTMPRSPKGPLSINPENVLMRKDGGAADGGKSAKRLDKASRGKLATGGRTPPMSVGRQVDRAMKAADTGHLKTLATVTQQNAKGRYADGGAVKGEPRTKIDINVCAGPKKDEGDDDKKAALLGALASAAKARPPGPIPPQPPGPGGPPMAPPGMKRGGRVPVPMDAGAGSGEGRLEKAALERRTRKAGQ